MTANTDVLDRAFNAIMTRMVETGRSPDYIELAQTLHLDPEVAREALSDIMATGYPGWLDEHDTIVTFCPFSNLPNQYRITVEGDHRWFGQ